MKVKTHVLKIKRGDVEFVTRFPVAGSATPRSIMVGGECYSVVKDYGEIAEAAKSLTDARHIDFKCLKKRMVGSCDQCIRWKEGCLQKYRRSKI